MDRNSSNCPRGCPREGNKASDKELDGAEFDDMQCCGSPPGQEVTVQETS